MDEDAFEEHRAEAELRARVGKDASVVRLDGRQIEHGPRLRHRETAQDVERGDGDDQAKGADHGKDAAPAEQVADDAGDGGAQHVAGQADRQQPADHDLALMDRHQVADQRHRDRKDAARDQPGRDAHGEHQREAGRERADQRRDRYDQQAHVHEPGLAEEIGDGAEHRLGQRIRQGERGRQQRRGLDVDQQIERDLRHHRIDDAAEQRRCEDDQEDDFQNGRDGRSLGSCGGSEVRNNRRH